MRMLEKEGFQQGDYVDIFDGGPTMVVQTDQVRSLSDAEDVQLAGAHREKGEKVLVASGRLREFRCTYGFAVKRENGKILLDEESIALLKLHRGDSEIGRAHVRTTVTNEHIVCRLLLENKKQYKRKS